jgi:pyrimidine operon attenuation protein / uracil phosphoribosyltransferase
MNRTVELLSEDDLRRTVTRLASQVVERCGDPNTILLLGILTRGVPLAHLLAQQIELLEGVSVPVGSLDITFYRDDLDTIQVRTPGITDLPTDLPGKTIVLVDDVIYSGRTIRAALNAITDYGRPNAVKLAVLIDRGHRELPIQPDFVGKMVPTARDEKVKVYLPGIDERVGVELLGLEVSGS